MDHPNWVLIYEYFYNDTESQEIIKKLADEEIKIVRDCEEKIFDESWYCDDIHEDMVQDDIQDDALNRTREFYANLRWNSYTDCDNGFFDWSQYEMDHDDAYQEWQGQQYENHEQIRILFNNKLLFAKVEEHMDHPNWVLIYEYFYNDTESQEIIKKLADEEIKIVRDCEEEIFDESWYCDDIHDDMVQDDIQDDALNRTREFYANLMWNSHTYFDNGFFDWSQYEMDHDDAYQEWQGQQYENHEQNRIDREYAEARERSIQDEKNMEQYTEDFFYELLKETEYPLIANFLITEELNSIISALVPGFDPTLHEDGIELLSVILKELISTWEIYRMDYKYDNSLDGSDDLDLNIYSLFEPLNEKDEIYRAEHFF